ncbi:MAG TPA: VWA domain-containing protein [Cytophagaceae bacterium]|nr:VWA domain-containing protein [Cytophagaceae bacterium]
MENKFNKLLKRGALLCLVTVLFALFQYLPSLGQAATNASGTFSPNDTTIKLKTSLDNLFYCPGKKEVYLYIDLKGCSLGKRIPLNISVVFDRSGSMEGERIHYGKMALDYLIDHLDPQDNMSIVIYDHIAEVLHGSEPVTNREELKKKLHHIHPRGATNISGGLEKGYEEVKSTYDNNKVNKVFLMSDGLPNEGITDASLLERMVKACSTKSNISLSTFGLGHEFDEVLMHDLAEAGGGHYYYIESPSDAPKELGSEIKTLLSVVAKNAGLTIEFPVEYLTLSRVYGQHHTLLNNTVHIDLKEVHPNETNGILLKFAVKQELNTPLIFNTALVYDNVLVGTRMIQKKVNILTPTNDNDSCDKKLDDSVLEKIVYFTTNDLLESAITDVDNNNISSAKNKLKNSKTMISSVGKQAQSGMLSSQYKVIDDYDKHLDNWDKKSEHEIKKLHKKTRHQNYKLRKLHGV